MYRTERKFFNKTLSHHGFGVFDKKGREIGVRIELSDAVFTTIVHGDYGYDMAPGMYYAFNPHATRDGHSYGASQSIQYFRTAAERDAAVRKYLAGARQRAEKTARK